MRINVEYLGHIKKLTNNTRQEEIDVKSPAAVTDVLMILTEKYGEPFKKAIYEPKASDVKSNYIITVNGYLLNQLNGVQTKLKDGDHVILLPIVSGG
jgi:molybdopterin synthase sulfur carrier subunit